MSNFAYGFLFAFRYNPVYYADERTLVSGQNNVYAYRTTVNAGTDVAVFGSFKINGNVDTSSYQNASIKITGYAVQADGFSTAADAWAAAPATWPTQQ